MHLDESTHIEMTNSIYALCDVIEALQARSGQPLSYTEMHVIRHAKDLRIVAIRQMRAAGVLPPGGSK